MFVLTGCAKSSQSNSTRSHSESTENVQKIVVTINGKKLKAHLNNSSAARSFAKEMPVTLKFRDFSNMPEKIADMDHALPIQGMPTGHAGTKGSIGYWSPQHRIVFYWGMEDYYEGIHIIGEFDSKNYREVIKNMDNNVNVRIAKAK